MTDRTLLKRVTYDELNSRSASSIDRELLAQANVIVDAVREKGEAAIRAYASQFGECESNSSLVLGPESMQEALASLNAKDRGALERAAARIRTFAQAQRGAIKTVTIPIPGGEAGHTIEPVASAGCYAPAGRYPLPSSVLMTAITARVAGCERVVVASPGANPVALAAAGIADADEFLAVGGAHAVAAMAYGFDGFPRCDVIAGPGNKWVSAAKQIVSSIVGIDMLAGPSELLVLADDTASPELVAADLLAQAEHDVDAVPMLVTTSNRVADQVDWQIERQLSMLDTRQTAFQALRNGFACVDSDMDACIDIVNQISPEHLEIMTADSVGMSSRIRNAGAVFIGSNAAEVLGDYGAGPNHTLPTAGTARFQAGLSVLDFMRLRTWMRIDDALESASVLEDTHRMARLEGLSAHAQSAAKRFVSQRKPLRLV